MYQDKDYPIPNRWVIGEYSYSRCPKSQVEPDIYWWIKAYDCYKNGVLPNVGGWLDQSNKYLEIMVFINNQISQHEREKCQKTK